MVLRALAQPHCIAVNESVACTDVGDEVIMLHVETGIYYGLDALGAEIWRALTEGVQEDTIVDRLLRRYDVDEAELRADVAVFLKNLEARGLVRSVAG